MDHKDIGLAVCAKNLEASWVVEAISKAKKARNISKPLVMHSGRGVQYTCEAYKEAIIMARKLSKTKLDKGKSTA